MFGLYLVDYDLMFDFVFDFWEFLFTSTVSFLEQVYDQVVIKLC